MRFLHPFGGTSSMASFTSPSSGVYELSQKPGAEWVIVKDCSLSTERYPFPPNRMKWCQNGPAFTVAFCRPSDKEGEAFTATSFFLRSGKPFRWFDPEQRKHCFITEGSCLERILGKEKKRWIEAQGQYYGQIKDMKTGKFSAESSFGSVLVEIWDVFEEMGHTFVVLTLAERFENALKEGSPLWAKCYCHSTPVVVREKNEMKEKEGDKEKLQKEKEEKSEVEKNEVVTEAVETQQ